MTSVDTQVKTKYGVVAAALAIIFGLFFAYDLFEAIANVIGVVGGVNHTNQISKNLGLPPAATIPWVILVVDILVAPVLYGVAFVIGRRRKLLEKAGFFLIALASSAALSLTVEEGFSKFFS